MRQANQARKVTVIDVCQCSSVMALAMGVLLTLSSYSAYADTHSKYQDNALQEMTTPGGYTFWHYAMPDAKRTAITMSWAQEVPLDESSHPAIADIAVAVMSNGGAGEFSGGNRRTRFD